MLATITRVFVLSLIVFLCHAQNGAASAIHEPDFGEYLVGEVFQGKLASVDLNSHPKAKTFRTRLRTAAKQGANFAGHFVLAHWGCGTGCTSFAFVDLQSGRVILPPMEVHFPPLSNEPHLMERYGIKYQVDSRLLVINGLPGNAAKIGSYYYEFKEGALRLVSFIEWDSTFNKE